MNADIRLLKDTSDRLNFWCFLRFHRFLARRLIGDQIADIPESFVAADDIEIGTGNKIPLWLFGFLY